MLANESSSEPQLRTAAPVALLAEDDIDLRAMISESLTEAGFRVEAFASGDRLLEALKMRFNQLGSPPDVVVTDVRMPGRTGLEVISSLRRFDFVTRVIVVTAFADANTRAIAHALGARLFSKPFDLDELTRAARGGPNDS